MYRQSTIEHHANGTCTVNSNDDGYGHGTHRITRSGLSIHKNGAIVSLQYLIACLFGHSLECLSLSGRRRQDGVERVDMGFDLSMRVAQLHLIAREIRDLAVPKVHDVGFMLLFIPSLLH